MPKLNRRQFVQSTVATCLVGAVDLNPIPALAQTDKAGRSYSFQGENYAWEWSEDHDQFRILNQSAEVLMRGPLQPVLVLQRKGQSVRRALAGKLQNHNAETNRASWSYGDDAGAAKLTVVLRFEPAGFWMEPVESELSTDEDLVGLHLFAMPGNDQATPALLIDDLVLPGICESELISPIADSWIGLDLMTSLGRTGSGITQQWGLPCHYFAGFRRSSGGAYVSEDGQAAQAFCCGLAELPDADVYVRQKDGRGSLIFDYRGDLWGHLPGHGKFTLSARLYLDFAPDYYQAIRGYYRGLLNAGIIHKKGNSARKNATLLTPQYCTWGQQMAMKKEGSRFDQASLEKCYDDMRASGLQAKLFSIDDRWEGKYGSLEHSAERFPHFEQFLNRLRDDGLRVGMWAAFMRCEDPASLGLTTGQMLQDGKPYSTGDGDTNWYLLDFTRPEVAEVLRDRARKFVRRYRPDLIKFDFGYEIPTLASVAPHDMRFAGERMLAKGLEVVVGAMREENPDIVVMYYHLSPLFTQYLDLHSSDDLGFTKGEYDLEANRRFFFSGLCGEFGMPTYGSSGYNWASASEIWFDSMPAGTVGSLIAFSPCDDIGGKATPEILAKYNGLTHLVRPTNEFIVQPLDPVYGSATRGAHASSWARYENNKPVLVALRPLKLDGGPGKTEFEQMVSTTAPVVVASRTEASIDQATRLGAVPYGEGKLVLRRASKTATQAKITEHFFGGAKAAKSLKVRGGMLEVALSVANTNSVPLEWIEIEIQ